MDTSEATRDTLRRAAAFAAARRGARLDAVGPELEAAREMLDRREAPRQG